MFDLEKIRRETNHWGGKITGYDAPRRAAMRFYTPASPLHAPNSILGQQWARASIPPLPPKRILEYSTTQIVDKGMMHIAPAACHREAVV
jgi:hypothetical protein